MGGSLSGFRIQYRLQVRHCTLHCRLRYDEDEQADAKNSVKRSRAATEDKKFYAKPMQITEPMKSELEIKIYRESTTSSSAISPQHGDEADGWDKVQRVIRPMPTALWGKCKSFLPTYDSP